MGKQKMVSVRALVQFSDVVLNQRVKVGQVYEATEERAKELANHKIYGKLVEIIGPVFEEAEKVEEVKVEKQTSKRKTTKKIKSAKK